MSNNWLSFLLRASSVLETSSSEYSGLADIEPSPSSEPSSAGVFTDGFIGSKSIRSGKFLLILISVFDEITDVFSDKLSFICKSIRTGKFLLISISVFNKFSDCSEFTFFLLGNFLNFVYLFLPFLNIFRIQSLNPIFFSLIKNEVI